MIKKIKNFIKNKKGFTLIETLVAITVLLLAIMGPLQIAAQALFSAFYSRDEITAYYLGEEAIEYIKNARDTTFLDDIFNHPDVPIDQNHWLFGLVGETCEETVDTKGCIIDGTQPFRKDSALNSLAIQSCPTSGCPPLLFDATSGIWTYNSADFPGATPSKFTRTVKIIPQNNDFENNGFPNEEALIEVTVDWTGGTGYGGKKEVVVKGLMTNWERK